MLIFVQLFLGLAFIVGGVGSYASLVYDDAKGFGIACGLFAALAFLGFVFTFYIR